MGEKQRQHDPDEADLIRGQTKGLPTSAEIEREIACQQAGVKGFGELAERYGIDLQAGGNIVAWSSLLLYGGAGLSKM